MNATLLALALFLEGALIFLGRWIYRNPRQLIPVSLYTNPDSPVLTAPVRGFAVVLIFMGSYGLLSALGGLVLRENRVLYFALPSAVALTFILRPRNERGPAEVGGAPTLAHPTEQGFLTRRGKMVLALTFAAVVVSTALAFLWLHGRAAH